MYNQTVRSSTIFKGYVHVTSGALENRRFFACVKSDQLSDSSSMLQALTICCCYCRYILDSNVVYTCISNIFIVVKECFGLFPFWAPRCISCFLFKFRLYDTR